MRPASLAALLLLPACGGTSNDEDVPAINLAGNGIPMVPGPVRPDARGPGTALGLTQLQLEQAQLLDPAGVRLGEVEAVELDRDGRVTDLRVELDDRVAIGRVVRIGLAGLAVVPAGAGWALRTATPPATLAALPHHPRPTKE